MKTLKKNKKKRISFTFKNFTGDFTNYSLQAVDQSVGSESDTLENTASLLIKTSGTKDRERKLKLIKEDILKFKAKTEKV